MFVDLGHGYRKACTVDRNDGKTCEFCKHSKRRDSGRLECPFQGGYQISKHSICNIWKSAV